MKIKVCKTHISIQIKQRYSSICWYDLWDKKFVFELVINDNIIWQISKPGLWEEDA